MNLSTLQGQCHCGNIRYRLEMPLRDGRLPARKCGCDFCTRFDAAWTSHPDASLDISVQDAELLSRYRFGTQTADFLFCGRCGIVVAALCELDGRTRAVVNVNSLRAAAEGDTEATWTPEFQPADFEGEGLAQRLERRRQNWIGNVRLA